MAEQLTHEVLIVGGGSAGVAAATQLARDGVGVLLIDKNNYHQFQPLLYQVATAQISVSGVARPLRGIFRKRKQVLVRTAEVTTVDAADRSVSTADGTTYRGRILVLAAGAEVNYFDTPGAQEHSFPLYSVDDASRLASRILGALDGADSRPNRSGSGLNVVVGGGGPTGVETAGAIAEGFKYVVPGYFSPELARSCSVYLVDMVPTVLAPFTGKSQTYAKKRLAKVGVQLKLGVGVAQVSRDGVVLADGSEIASRVVVWAGGLTVGPMLAASGLPQGKGGRIDVATDLTVPGFPGVYVLGDAANIIDAKGRHLPQLGSVAQQVCSLRSGRRRCRSVGRPQHQGRPRGPATRAVPVPRQGHHGHDRSWGRGSRGRRRPPPAAGPTGFRGVAGGARGVALRHPRADRGGALMGVGLLHPQQATDRRWPAGRVRRRPGRHCRTRPRWHSPGLRPSSGTDPEMPAWRLFSSQRGSYPTAAAAL